MPFVRGDTVWPGKHSALPRVTPALYHCVRSLTRPPLCFPFSPFSPQRQRPRWPRGFCASYSGRFAAGCDRPRCKHQQQDATTGKTTDWTEHILQAVKTLRHLTTRTTRTTRTDCTRKRTDWNTPRLRRSNTPILEHSNCPSILTCLSKSGRK